MWIARHLVLLSFAIGLICLPPTANAQPSEWKREWPRTDFTRHSIPLREILSGGPHKDGIPAIDRPTFKSVSAIDGLSPAEPVIALEINGEAKAYPLRVLMWHEIANDTIGGVPVTVTYCPLCNTSIAFDRRLNGRVLDFGVSGKLRYSDLVMYDRQTESWWQQFLGQAIVGEMTGSELTRLPARVLPFAEYKVRHPNGLVLVPSHPRARSYGKNPYEGYDTSYRPFLYQGNYEGPIPALAYVVAVEAQAWPLEEVKRRGRVEHGDFVITWAAGMNSALDSRSIERGRDIGFVTVQRKDADGTHIDISHDVTFAFAFSAFNPTGIIHSNEK